nr:hypothetical protein [Tanacetum cinerariifolium]
MATIVEEEGPAWMMPIIEYLRDETLLNNRKEGCNPSGHGFYVLTLRVPKTLGLAKGMSEGSKHGIEHERAGRDLADIEAYDPEADNKYVKALHGLKDLKYPMVDELEKLKDAHIDVIMASLYLEKTLLSESETLLEDAITANISQAKKMKKCRVVCRTHGVGSTHHARSDGVPVPVPTIALQGLAILLADATTQTEISEDEASLSLLRSKSLPPMYNLD